MESNTNEICFVSPITCYLKIPVTDTAKFLRDFGGSIFKDLTEADEIEIEMVICENSNMRLQKITTRQRVYFFVCKRLSVFMLMSLTSYSL